MTSPRGPIPSLLVRLAELQLARPWQVVGVTLLAALCSLALATRLTLRTGLGALLPSGKRSVVVAEEVRRRLPSTSSFILVAEGSDDEGLKRFVDAAAPALAALPKELVGSVDSGVQATQAFFEENKLLYAPLELVEEAHREIEERYEYEVGKRSGALLDDEEEPAPLDEATIRARVEARAGKDNRKLDAATAKYPGGYYLDPEKHVVALRVLTPIASGDAAASARLQALAREALDKLDPKRFDPKIRVGFTGDLLTSAEVHQQIVSDSTHVGLWGVGLVLAVVLLYFLRVRTLLAMGLTVATGASFTFGLAYLTIGYLDQSTGFSFSIVVGNGINFGILYMARYLEARRSRAVAESIHEAHQGTWEGTLTAAAAATAAYGSLAITDFRGFKYFGVIGGTGMLMCWLATFLLMPALLVVSERILPIDLNRGIAARGNALYGRPFAWLVERASGGVLVVGLVVTVAAFALAWRYVANDPMEYNMRNVDNAPVDRPTEARRLMGVANGLLPSLGLDGIALAVDRLEQVRPLAAELERRRDAVASPPFGRVVTVYSLLPTDQEKKLGKLRSTRALLERAHAKGFLGDEDWRKLVALVPERILRPLGIDELPEAVARPFTEADGTRGKLVYLEPAPGRSVWDARYLIEWAASFRRTDLPDGSVVEGSGRSVIFADMIQAIVEDAPRAILTSLVLTVLLVVLAFRGRAGAYWVVGSILVGFVWTVAVLAVARSKWPWSEGGFVLEASKLNFLNFIALPITLGVGSDYAVNVMKRYEEDGELDVVHAVRETGGAVVLCSLTTMFGYGALTLSVNQAIQSFGIAAAAGEVACLATALLVMPSALVRLRRRATTRG
jgi:predicted RND superfamily exporter protein